MHIVCTIVKFYQPLKYNHCVIQRLKWSLECYKGTFRANPMVHNELLSWSFPLFYWLVENSPAGSVYLLTWWLHVESVYMRCMSVFRNVAPLMRESVQYQNESTNTLLHVHACCVWWTPGDHWLLESALQIISHVFPPSIYSLISPQCVFL